MTMSSWVLDSRVQREQEARVAASRRAAREAAAQASRRALDRAMSADPRPSKTSSSR